MQLSLFRELKRQAEYGGSLLEGKRKGSRPFAKKKAMHVTFRRSNAYCDLSLLGKQKRIQNLMGELAKKHGVQIYDCCVNSNHIHLLLKSPLKVAFQNFLRECSIKIVWLMTSARKGKKLLTPFWESRPWSRIVEWGRALRAVRDYLFRNRLEASGLIPYNRSIKTGVALQFAPP